MITPSYSATATERVLPRMALDFTTASLDSRVTVTRALNTATAINSSGFIAVVNANLPRFDYNPVTLACKGLLIEEARTNILTYSEQFDNAAWAKLNVTVSANNTTSPDGTLNAEKLVVTNAGTNANCNQSPALTASTSYTETVYAKKAEWGWVALEIRGESIDAIQAWFNLNTGVVGTIVGAGTATITDAGNGWYRCSLTRTMGVTTTSPRLRVYPTNANALFSTGDGTSGIFVWGAQLELGAFATSYIPTTTSSLTRNRDDVSMTGANFSSWYQAGSGTLQAIMTRYPVATGYPRLVSLSDNTANNEIAILNFNPNAGVGVGVTNGGSTQASTFISLTGNEENMAFRFGTNDFALSLNSSAVVTDTSGTVPTVSQMLIGTGPLATSPVCSGWYKKILFFNNKLISNELRSVSKL